MTDVAIPTDRESGRPRGFAFVTMETKEGMDAAINALNGKDFLGRPLTINEARPRKIAPPTAAVVAAAAVAVAAVVAATAAAVVVAAAVAVVTTAAAAAVAVATVTNGLLHLIRPNF